jgi:hypothetical protein
MSLQEPKAGCDLFQPFGITNDVEKEKMNNLRLVYFRRNLQLQVAIAAAEANCRAERRLTDPAPRPLSPG